MIKRSNLYSNDHIHIQTIKFEFKRINQELTAHYHTPAPVTDGSADSTARSGSSASGTAWSGRVLPLPPGPTVTSSRMGGSAHH
jgi:hypothetical protein